LVPLDVPVLSRIAPVLADDVASAFGVEIEMEPEPDVALVPLTNVTDPPPVPPPPPPPAMVTLPPVVELTPLDITIFPPESPTELPTIILMEPARPLVAEPDSRDTDPVLPTFEVPVLNKIEPETPEDTTFAVVMRTDPLPELVLLPL
jgi:hypothetical protein